MTAASMEEERPSCMHCDKALDADPQYGWRHWWSGRVLCTQKDDSTKGEPVDAGSEVA